MGLGCSQNSMVAHVLSKALGATVLSSVNWAQDGVQNLWGPHNKNVRPLVKNMIINFKTKCRTLVTTGVTDPEWPFPVLKVKA